MAVTKKPVRKPAIPKKSAKKPAIAQKVSKTGAPKSPERKKSKPVPIQAIPQPKKQLAARVVYSEKIVDAICTRIAQGESLIKICKDAEMPNRTTFMRWLHEGTHDGLHDKYARARESQADFYAEEIIQIADTPIIGSKTKINEKGELEVTKGDMIEHRRLQVDARKWYASKVAPKKYGDKLALGQADDLLPLVSVKDLTGRKD